MVLAQFSLAQVASVMVSQIAAGEASVVVEVIGEGEVGILFVHGLGSEHGCWHRAAEYLELKRYRLILPDLPGFGRSTASNSFDYSMKALGASLRAVVDAVGLSRWHVVAHSMGGAAALELCADGEQAPCSFVCVEGNLVAEDAFMSRKIARLSESAFRRAYPKWLEMVEASLGGRSNEQHARYLDALKATSPVAVYRAACECFKASCSGALARPFAALSCPVAYVYGEHTRRTRGLPDVAWPRQILHFEVPDEGHFVMEAADCFYGWLSEWLNASS